MWDILVSLDILVSCENFLCVAHAIVSALTPGDSQMSDVNTILSQHSCSAPVDSAHVFSYEVNASQIWFSSFAADFCFS